jgi:hypothetical protein
MTELRIFNIIGQEVAKLFSENGKAGQPYTVHFNAIELPTASTSQDFRKDQNRC